MYNIWQTRTIRVRCTFLQFLCNFFFFYRPNPSIHNTINLIKIKLWNMNSHWFTGVHTIKYTYVHWRVQCCREHQILLAQSVTPLVAEQENSFSCVCCRDMFMHLIRTFLIRTYNVSWIRKLDLKSRLVL